MDWLWILLGIIGVILLIFLIILIVCFKMAFYSPKRGPRGEDEFSIPDGEIYEPYRETMVGWMKEVRGMPCEEMSVESFDGLTLRGKFYSYSPEAPVEIMFHGYRGDAERDLCGGVQRCFALGHSALVVDQRASGYSDGNVISFGVNESRDCLTWIDFAVERFGKEVKLYLTGISMGASTVLLAAGYPLPENVIGILADCGYSSAPEIIRKVVGEMGLPSKLAYPFVRLSAKLFGGFDIEDADVVNAVSKCSVPVIFFHGDADAYVPCEMSKYNYDACPAKKRFVTVPGAGHGLSCLIDTEGYLKALREFWE